MPQLVGNSPVKKKGGLNASRPTILASGLNITILTTFHHPGAEIHEIHYPIPCCPQSL